MIVLRQVKCHCGDSEAVLRKKCAKLLHCDVQDILSLTILRESFDARKKPDVLRVLELGVTLRRVEGEKAECQFVKMHPGLSLDVQNIKPYQFPYKAPEVFERPIIVGFGPAGLFCGLLLARAGYRPIILERGKAVNERQADVESFWAGGSLNPESNVQFGEGGAGTFSDGKLNTLVKGSKDLQRFVLETFVSFGADPDICYSAKPHIGTDVLSEMIPRMRKEIEACGGEVRFSSRLDDIELTDGRLRALTVTTNGETVQLQAETVCLAIGHSARDTFRMLKDRHIPMEAKPFAVGVRVEHDQDYIAKTQYGDPYDEALPTASYKLTAQASEDRGVYSFCMCPGGYIVNASSQPGRLCVNGMSYHDRASGRANSAIVVTVRPGDFPGDDVLSGVYWQEAMEEAAFAHRQGAIPVQTWGDFRKNRPTEDINTLHPCVKGRWTGGNEREFLPPFITKALEEGFATFGRKMKGFDAEDTLLLGLESRTSSPVRICRDEELESEVKGLFPCGEGAGYAGGITSAAVDGCRVAQAIARYINERKHP